MPNVKIHIQTLWVSNALLIGFCWALSGQIRAQTLTTLHNFSATTDSSSVRVLNSDGADLYERVILSGNTLYGIATSGGSSGNGTLFKVNTDGTGFTNLHTFSESPTNGMLPFGGLCLSSNTLYGTTAWGATPGGRVYAVSTDGTGFNIVHSFEPGSGACNYGGLIVLGNSVYGTGSDTASRGTVFKVNKNGTGFQTLHTLAASEGADLIAGLVVSGVTLYGTAQAGGSLGVGTVFALNIDGTGFSTLHSFTGSDGANPRGGLVLLGNTLYGTANDGGSSSNGTVFSVKTDGTSFTTLHRFTGSDGTSPWGALVLSGTILYGTTEGGGRSGNGTVFALNIDGTGFTTLYSFSAGSGPYPDIINNDGASPFGGLTLSGATLYGTTLTGGSSGNGTVFSLSFTPQLSITPAGGKIILTWPTTYAGFDYTGYNLQSTTNLASPIWSAHLPAPVVVNGQRSVTGPISGTQQSFRLIQ
jgi:uncharacterized repeat protein (TIGR03803 family)